MKKLILSMMVLAANGTANAEDLNATVVKNNETIAEVVAPAEAPAPEVDTTEKNTWGAKLHESPFSDGLQ